MYVFDHNLSLDRLIRTQTRIIIDHNKVKEHANFWIKPTFRDRVINVILNFVKKGVVKNSKTKNDNFSAKNKQFRSPILQKTERKVRLEQFFRK